MSDPQPVRLQRRRTKGFRLVSPNGLPVKCVTRPGPWGNPYKVGDIDDVTGKVISQGGAFHLFRGLAMQTALDVWRDKVREALRGQNLACYCDLPAPGKPDLCHARLLLFIANTRDDAELTDRYFNTAEGRALWLFKSDEILPVTKEASHV